MVPANRRAATRWSTVECQFGGSETSMVAQDEEKFDPPSWSLIRLYDPGVFWGLTAVFAFSLTVPLTRIAAPTFGAVVAGLGRAALAALFAAAFLLTRREHGRACAIFQC
jgi:hypothetical protein